MAQTFAAALRDVASPAFDTAVGLAREPVEAAPVDPEVEAAFSGFDQRELAQMADQLASLEGTERMDAEDAISDGLIHLWETRPDLFREDPLSWMGLLFATAKQRLMRTRHWNSTVRPESLDHMAREDEDGEVTEPQAFSSAKPAVAYTKMGVNEEAREIPPPLRGRGYAWSREQVIGAVQRFRDATGRSPTWAEMQADPALPGDTSVYRHFDSIEELCREAGTPPPAYSRRKRWTHGEAVAECMAFKRRNGFWPGRFEANRFIGQFPGHSALERFFGGTTPAAVQLGCEAYLRANPPRKRRWLSTLQRRARLAAASLRGETLAPGWCWE